MRFAHSLSALATTAAVALSASLAAAPAQATSAAFVANALPALTYRFAPFERRGVDMPGGVLLVREDGCWSAEVEVQNASGMERTVSVIMRVKDARGRHLTNLVVVDREALADADGVRTRAQGCDAALAQGFPPRPHAVSRVFSVR